MMTALLIAIGCGVIAFATWDLFWTTLGEGGGPITRRIAKSTWMLFFRLHRQWPEQRLLSMAGVVIILTTITCWIVLLWAGWTFIFAAATGTVHDTVDGSTASFWEHVYFTGYMLSTLGVGDVQPRGELWRVLTALASISGLFQISFSIAYLIPLALAATYKRKIATMISCLGKTADDVILNMWNGSDWQMLTQYLQHLTPELSLLNQQHLTYPVLHYFHSHKRPDAIGPSLAILDEALTIVEHGLEEGRGPDPGAFHAARRMISDFLQTLDAAFGTTETEAPPVPPLDRLRDRDLPVVDDETFQERVQELEDRRSLLRALLQNDSWEWAARAASTDDETGDETEALSEVEAI